MKLILASDGHISDRYPFSFNPNPFEDIFFKKSYQSIQRIVIHSIDNGRIPIVFNGDLFDSEKIGSVELFAALRILDTIRENNIDTFFNIGNHEIGYEGKIPNIVGVIGKSYSNARVADYKNKWTVFEYNGLNMYFVPSVKDRIFNEIINEMCDEKIKTPAALFIHQNIKNIRLGKTHVVDGISESELINKISGRFNFVVCGHLHHHHIDNKFGVPLFVPGSTSSVDFRDEGSKKSFIVLNLDDNYNVDNWEVLEIGGQIEFVSYDLRDITEDIIKNSFNKVIRLYYSSEDRPQDTINKLKEFGAVVVVGEVSKKTNDVVPDFVRPIQMEMKDWFAKYLDERIYDGDEIERLIKIHEEIFSNEQ